MVLKIPFNVRLPDMVVILCRKYQIRIVTIAPDTSGVLWLV